MNIKNGKSAIFTLLIVMMISTFLPGCGAGSASSGGSAEGAYSLSIAWPDGTENLSKSRVIPSGSVTCEVTITGDELTYPVTTSISFPSTSITVVGLPLGNKVAEIKALDSSSNILAQRRESFTIENNTIITSDHVPLGIAIAGSADSPSFEPSSVNVPYGTNLYFQNWTTGAFTCTALKNCYLQSNVPIGASSQNSSGKWTFAEGILAPWEDTTFALSGFPLVTGLARSPVKNYTASSIIDDSYEGAFGMIYDSSGNIYVSDFANSGVIKKYNSNWSFITSWGTGTLNRPYGIAFDSKSILYVCDRLNRRIVKFDTNGNLKGGWGSQGTGDTQFESPFYIAVNSNDNVFVTDPYNGHRIMKFSSAGGFLTKWYPRLTPSGSIGALQGITIDKAGNLLMASNSFEKVLKYDSVGNLLTYWGSHGTEEGQFDNCLAPAVDKSGNIYVIDNSRVTKFDSQGNYLTRFGSSGTGAGQLTYPFGITISNSGDVFVTEKDNAGGRIVKFAPVL